VGQLGVHGVARFARHARLTREAWNRYRVGCCREQRGREFPGAFESGRTGSAADCKSARFVPAVKTSRERMYWRATRWVQWRRRALLRRALGVRGAFDGLAEARSVRERLILLSIVIIRLRDRNRPGNTKRSGGQEAKRFDDPHCAALIAFQNP
jgi:hypothetical protein